MILEKIKAFVFLVLMLIPLTLHADDDDKKMMTTINFQGGKRLKEKQEIEVYDYHSGTYYSVFVYREPENQAGQPEAKSSNDPKPASQTRP